MIRLTLGEYETRTVCDGEEHVLQSVHRARNSLLDHASHLEPNLLQELSEAPLKDYWDFIKRMEAHTNRPSPNDWESPGWEAYFKQPPPQFESLIQWAKRWNLSTPWCLKRAKHLLSKWSELKLPLLEEQKYWIHPKIMWAKVSSAQEREFSFKHLSWDLTDRTRLHIEKYIRNQFDKELKSFLDHLEFLAIERGYKIGPRKYGPVHLEWLALFQVKSESYKQIFETYRKKYNLTSERAVQKAVKDLALFIQLDLRDDNRRRGRPRVSRTP